MTGILSSLKLPNGCNYIEAGYIIVEDESYQVAIFKIELYMLELNELDHCDYVR